MIELAKVSYRDTAKKVMVIGLSGSGKTRFLGTFPKPFIASFDGEAGLETLAGHPTAKAESYYGPEGWVAFRKELDRWLKDGPQYGCETFCIDSLTTMGDAALDAMQKKHGLQPGDTMHQGVWGEVIGAIRDVLADGTVRLKCNFVLTAHLQAEKDDLLGGIVWQPLVYGAKLPGQAPLYFSEVYHTKVEVDLKTGKANYVLQVVPDTKLKFLKSRMNRESNCFSLVEAPDMEKLIAKAHAAKG